MAKLPDQTRQASGASTAPQEDSLEAFRPEQSLNRPFLARAGSRRTLAAAGVLAGVLLVAAIAGDVIQRWRPGQVEASAASVAIESNPAGAEVHLAGVRKGNTPLVLTVGPGEQRVEVVHGDRRKSLTITATAGVAVVHHVELPEPPPRPPAPAPPEEPAPAVPAATPKPPAPAGPSAGWLTIAAAIPLQVVERGQVIGTSEASRIMLPAGRHDLRLVNESLGFSERRTVQVPAGGRASVRVTLPSAPVSINAVPWAEVWIGRARVGETPIGNHMVPIGSHEVVFRHPEFGERRQTVVVSLARPARVSVDMRPRP